MRARVLLVAGLLCSLTGCSQVAAIAPVGGDHLAEVRYAGNDVLVSRAVPVLVAPVCTGDTEIRCSGRTSSGEEITVLSTAADPSSVTVSVGPATLYTGGVQAVLDRAARPAS